MVRPMGNETLIAIIVVSKVRDINGKIPKCLLAKRGVHSVSVKNSKIDTSLKKLILLLNKTQIIPIVVNMVIKAAPFKIDSIIFSLVFLFNLDKI